MELKASELRIGNKVAMRSITVNENITVTGVIENKIYYTPCKTPKFADFLWSLPIYIYPIELTEEWLVEFGFDENRCILLGIDTSFHLLQITPNLDVNVYDVNDNFVCLKSIKYVHELQNLYFALTGNELKIK